MSFSRVACSFGCVLAMAVVGCASALGCASGQGVIPRNGDGGGRDGGDRTPDSGFTCDPACAPGESCVAGTCVAGTADADHDGVATASDCDDANPSVGRMSERSCSSSCGTGVERCTDGIWAACTAPSSCACTDGEPPRTIACMHCGMQQQVCTGGVWADSGLCTGGGPCSPGDIDTGGTCGNCGMQTRTCQADCTWGAWSCTGGGECAAGTTDTGMQGCGTCGTGTQSRSRTCSDTCTWGAWTSWSACVGGGVGTCAPGDTQTDTQACGNCGSGHQTRTRSCDTTTCDWGAWSGWGACSGETGCTPGSTTACSPEDDCGQRVCTASCTWSGCQPRVSGGCLCNNSSPGSGCRAFQCCTTGGGSGGWQFCSPSTCRYNPCAAHSC